MLELSDIESKNFATASNAYVVYDRDHDKDIFEKVIDSMILEKYADKSLKDYINELPNNRKRIATLSLIGDDNILWSKINDILKENKTGYQRLKQVYFLLRDYVKIADVERKKHGEILTPFKELAGPMIKLVEKYDVDFWKNKNHKVLDSSAGYGTFLILAAYKFMVGLKDELPDEEERFKWIVENCLYYGELQARSVFSWLVAIDPYDEYKTNTYWGSFLTDDFDKHMKEVWVVEKFDLIIQNPPYQMRKEGFKKTQPMWHLFVQKSLTLLKEGGYMIMVHPGSWRDIDGSFKDIQNLLKSRQMLYLEIHSRSDGFETFGVGTRYEFYILKNRKNDGTQTIIKGQNGETIKIDISSLEFIPNGMFEEIFSCIAQKNEEKVNVLHSYSAYETRKNYMSKEKSTDFKYPCVYTVSKNGNINLYWSISNNRGHFGIPKMIWSNGESMYAGSFVDILGDYGLTQFSYAIIDDKNNLENIKIAFDSDMFRNMMRNCEVSTNSINKKIVSSLKKDFWKEFI